MKISILKAIGLAAITALVCVGCTDSGVDTNGREVDVFLDRVDGTTYPLMVNANPSNGGSVSRNPNNYGSTYTPGENVTVTATATTGSYRYAFTNWSGDYSGTTSPIQIKMDGPKTVTANFKRAYMLTANPSPYDGGSVYRNPTNSPNLSNSVYLEGTQVTVTATAASGYAFTGWTNTSTGVQISAASQYTVTMNSDIALTANFKRQYTLTVNANPSNGGSVYRNPTNSPNLSNSVYLAGDSVLLTATANSGYAFTGWADGSTANPRRITINGAVTLTANFSPVYRLTTSVTPTGSGSVERSTNSIDANGNYVAGTRVTVTSRANPGYTFNYWRDASGAQVSTAYSYTFTMDGPRTLTAVFEQDRYTLTVNANPQSGGSVSRSPYGDNSTTYTYGAQVTLTATPAANYRFTGWVNAEGVQVSTANQHTVTMYGSERRTANFQQQYTITLNANGGTGATPTAQAVDAGQCVSLQNQGSLTRSGYSFGGWIDMATGNTYNAGASYCPNGNVALYARWTSIVTFSANGGSGTPPGSETVTTGNSISLPYQGYLSRTGYTFNGWNTQSDGTGPNYNTGSLYTPAGNITLYARWTCTITFDANGGSGNAPAAIQNANAGSSITLPNHGNMTKSGYTFAGWHTNSGALEALYTAGAYYSVSGTITLYAIWKAEP